MISESKPLECPDFLSRYARLAPCPQKEKRLICKFVINGSGMIGNLDFHKISLPTPSLQAGKS